MKSEIYSEINRLENSSNELDQKKGRCVRLIADTISCFDCLDTRRYMKDRDNLPWSAIDGRGYYDIMGCKSCNNCGWMDCSHLSVNLQNGIRIYRLNNTDWKDRVDQLYNKGQTETKVPETKADGPLFEVCKLINRKHIENSLEVDIEIGKIIEIIKDTVEAYFGNIFSLIDLCRELKVSFSISDSQSLSTDKLIKIKDNNYLGIKTCVKVTQSEIKTGLFRKSRLAREYSADIFILKPLNVSADEKAKIIMSKIGEEMTDDILKDF